jgi:glutamate racemase
MQQTKIGVFDSGIGGQSVINAIKKELPHLEIIYKSDKEHFPYGSRSIEEIYGLVRPIFQDFLDEDCEVIIVACNTVTTNLIAQLRRDFPVPIVGIEPMVKPAAANTEAGVIAVCATPRTLQSARYKWLKDTYAQGVKVLEPDCSDWAQMIESDKVDRQKIRDLIDSICKDGADQIVLGCTHYHWIEQLISELAAGRAEVIQPEAAVVKQLKKVLQRLA